MKLIDALKIAFKVAKDKNVLPILNHVRFEPGLIEATNLDVWVRIKADYNGPRALLPVQVLKDATKKAKILSIGLGVGEGKFVISNGAYKTEVLGAEDRDFPSLPAEGVLEPIPGVFTTTRMARAQARLVDNLSDDETRMPLLNYALEVYPAGTAEGQAIQGAARLVACDGHSLSTAMARNLGSREGTPSTVLIPPFALDLALRCQATGILRLAQGKMNEVPWLCVKNDEVEVYNRQADVQYPDWRGVVPAQGMLSFGLKGSELAAVLAAAAGEVHAVILEPNDSDCVVSWADDSSENQVTQRGTLKTYKAGNASATRFPRLRFALAKGHLRALAGRSEGVLTLTVGGQAKTAADVDRYDQQAILFADPDQAADEISLLMPVRVDKGNGSSGFDSGEGVEYLVKRGYELGIFKEEAQAA